MEMHIRTLDAKRGRKGRHLLELIDQPFNVGFLPLFPTFILTFALHRSVRMVRYDNKDDRSSRERE